MASRSKVILRSVRNLSTRVVSVFGIVLSQSIPDRIPSLQENIYSFEARNFNVFTVERHISPDAFGQNALNCVIERCFDQDKLERVISDSVNLRYVELVDWVKNRDLTILRKIDGDMANINNWRDYMSYFKLMVKREAKVKLDSSAFSKHNPAQNIVFHVKFINAVYGPMFKALIKRVRLCLLPNIFMYTEMTSDDFSKKLFSLLGGTDTYYKGEIDFSKFDKSQDFFCKNYELKLYSLFGLDAEFLELWGVSEYYCRARSIHNDLSFEIHGQRRSGTANTFFGNCMITLMMLSLYYDLRKFRAVAVAGDDSILFSDVPVQDYSDRMIRDNGFEAKFIRDQPAYFCSRFIVFANDSIYFIPDPYKIIVKLGKPLSDVTISGLKERFISFKDYTKYLDLESVVYKLSLAVNIRYSIEGRYTYAAICSLHCIRANFKRFREMYPHTLGVQETSMRRVIAILKRFFPVLTRGRSDGDPWTFGLVSLKDLRSDVFDFSDGSSDFS